MLVSKLRTEGLPANILFEIDSEMKKQTEVFISGKSIRFDDDIHPYVQSCLLLNFFVVFVVVFR